VHIGAVTEDNGAAGVAAITLMTSGVLTIADVDQGQSNFTAQAGTTGGNNYGTFTLAGDGHWSYSADNTQTAIQQLGAGQSLTDSFTAVSSDGTASQLITVTINGTNDVPVLGGVHIGAVTEDNGAAGVAAITLMTSGVLTIADVDQANRTSRPKPAPRAATTTAPSRWPATATGATAPTTRRRRSSSWAPANRSPTASPRSPPTAPPAS